MDEPNRHARLRVALERFEAPLLRYAVHLTGDPELARDVVQDAFARACGEPADSLDGNLAAWLFAVCRNRAIDVRRKERRMKPLALVETDAATSDTPDALVENRDSAARVLQLLATLPANQQEVVRLKFQAGLSYREIADVTKLSVTNIGFLIHTALKAVREKLKISAAPARRAQGRSS